MSRDTLGLEPSLRDYLLSVSVREDELLRRLREETSTLQMAQMQISPEQGQFMALLARIMGARRALEVGTFTGYSAICVARALPHDGELICCDVNEEWTAIARRYWREDGLSDRVRLELAPAAQTLEALIEGGASGRFDLAFIDADKESYAAYHELVLQLLRPGGVVLYDNVLWGGSVIDEADTTPSTVAIRALNQALLSDDRVDLSMIPLGDGLTICRKR